MKNLDHKLPEYLIAAQVSAALAEDLHACPDWSANLIAPEQLATAQIKTNSEMVLCGQEWVNYAFSLVNPNVQITWEVSEGQCLAAGSILCRIHGPARSLLTAERTALNFLQTLAATATHTRSYCQVVADLPVKIMDTRKTLPGLRLAQKYAVRVGGGSNQRVGLFDGVLLKENHILAHGGIQAVLEQAYALTPAHIPIQIEVETFAELVAAVTHKAKLILLDNMSLEQIRHCVAFCQAHDVALEVSGNVNLTNVRDYALTGVARISIGGLTKNVHAIDLSMRFI